MGAENFTQAFIHSRQTLRSATAHTAMPCSEDSTVSVTVVVIAYLSEDQSQAEVSFLSLHFSGSVQSNEFCVRTACLPLRSIAHRSVLPSSTLTFSAPYPASRAPFSLQVEPLTPFLGFHSNFNSQWQVVMLFHDLELFTVHCSLRIE